MPTATEIILEYVCPLLGCIVAYVMFMAPVKDVREAVINGTLGSLNPTPWAVMTGNCVGWVAYSYLVLNLFVLVPNAYGFMVSVWLNMAAVKLQYSDRMAASLRSSFVQLLDSNRKSFRGLDRRENIKDAAVGRGGDAPVQTFANLRKMALEITTQKAEAPAPHEKVVIGFVGFWLVVISILSFLKLTLDQWKLVIGIIANINTFFFYGAPLSTIVTVLKTRDSSSIHRRTMITNTANGVFWTAFGFGSMDWIIITPNGVGAILGFIQMFICLVIPNREKESSDKIESQGVQLTEEELDVDVDVEATASTTSTNFKSEDLGDPVKD